MVVCEDVGLGLPKMDSSEGFRVIGIKFSEDCNHIHYIKWKVHVVREYSLGKPPALTLFIMHLPPYITEASLKMMMLKYGKVRNVFLHEKPDGKTPLPVKYPIFDRPKPVEGFKVGYVVFTSPKAVKKVMSLPSSTVLIASTKEHPIITESSEWDEDEDEHFCSNESMMKAESKRIMEDFDKKKELETNDNEPDEEGWVTVTSNKRKRKATEQPGSKSNKFRKKKKTQPVHFYTFQKKAAKLEYLSQQQKKYEEDRKRLAEMKSARKFKPL